jgi:SNF2 family DNA or RNA helicase
VPLEGAQRTLYETVRIAVDEQVRRVLERQGLARGQIEVLDALLKLRQVCNHPRLLKTPGAAGVPSAKLALLMQMLPALVAEGRQVLVFSQFTEMLALVAEALAALPAAERLPWLQLTGDTPARQRGEVVRAFQAGEAPLLLLSLKAGGVGLNLTAADTVIHLDPWWNPAVQAQATARAHRIGQHRPVFAYQLVAEGSIEERLLALQARKAALAEGVLGQDAAFAPKFGEDDLRGLLAPLR